MTKLPFKPSAGFLDAVAQSHPAETARLDAVPVENDTVTIQQDWSPGKYEQAVERLDRRIGHDNEDREATAQLIAEAQEYARKSGIPVQITYGLGDLVVECDRRTIRVVPDDALFIYASEYFEGHFSAELGRFHSFEEAAEAPLPRLQCRTLRVTLDVQVIDAPESIDPSLNDADAEDPSVAIEDAGLLDLEPEDVADLFECDAPTGDNFMEHPFGELLTGSGVFARFGDVRVHDAEWLDIDPDAFEDMRAAEPDDIPRYGGANLAGPDDTDESPVPDWIANR